MAVYHALEHGLEDTVDCFDLAVELEVIWGGEVVAKAKKAG